jgi:hypothetical protein
MRTLLVYWGQQVQRGVQLLHAAWT